MEEILITGDKVMYLPLFGSGLVVVQPGTLSGSASTVETTKKATCTTDSSSYGDDEKSAEVAGCQYIAPPFVVPGSGTLKITNAMGGQSGLKPDQVSKKTTADGKAVMIKGIMCSAEFHVQTPAQMPPPVSTTDPLPTHTGGMGMFMNNNFTVADNG